jgi:subtilisin family serine protease
VSAIFPTATLEEVCDAIIDVIDAGARIINLSLGLSTSALVRYSKLQEVYDYARKHDVIIVVAAGNQGNVGSSSLFNDDWIIPVATCDIIETFISFGFPSMFGFTVYESI